MLWLIPAIGAAIGAISGAVSTRQKAKREINAIEHQKDQSWQQYQYGKEYSDAMFGVQRSEALEHLGAQERSLNQNVKLSTDEFNTSLLAQAYGIQDARISNALNTGMSLAYEGASGTRGSESNGLMRAYADASLERDIEVQGRQNTDYLNSMLTGANQAADAIGRERSSWMPGGSRMQEKDIRDQYNLNIANLGQSGYDWQIQQAKPTGLDYFTNMFAGASSGLALGGAVKGFGDKWGFDWRNIFKKDKSYQADIPGTGR